MNNKKMLPPGCSLIPLNCIEGIIVILRISVKKKRRSRNSYLFDSVHNEYCLSALLAKTRFEGMCFLALWHIVHQNWANSSSCDSIGYHSVFSVFTEKSGYTIISVWITVELIWMEHLEALESYWSLSSMTLLWIALKGFHLLHSDLLRCMVLKKKKKNRKGNFFFQSHIKVISSGIQKR